MTGAALFAALLGLFILWLVRALHPPWWARRPVRFALVGLMLLAPIGVLVRSSANAKWVGASAAPVFSIVGATLGGAGAIATVALLLTIPVAGLVRALLSRYALKSTDDVLVNRADPAATPAESASAPEACEQTALSAAKAIEAPSTPVGSVPSLSRRQVLEVAVAALPVAALGVAGVGVGSAFRGTQVLERRFRFAGLPAGLEGLRILQITDLHLGAFRDLESMPKLAEVCAAAKPDLVVVTGDFCDHIPWLQEGLHRVKEIPASLGTYAVLGNHEHYRGVRANRLAYDKANIPLLMDKHAIVDHRGTPMLLVGVDDPSGWDHSKEHYERHADLALDGAPSDTFSLALCHRPSGFDALTARRMHLTLSGHTHGAQVGTFGERSALEPVMRDQRLWGKYAQGDSQLYTSSGAGHWAAFRLACPSEAPLIVLERA